MSDHIVEARNLHFAYPDGQCAIDEVSFTVNRGESIGIVGTNGAGKSTLLLLLLGILFPCTGDINIANIPVTKKNLSHVREKIGMVFQNPDDQLFMPTVYDDVAFGPRNYKLDEDEVSKRVLNALQTVGISHLKNRAPYRLSGGEKRAATIASVLSMHIDLLIMDEPTASLDPKSRRRIINLLKSFDHTKIIATHDLDMIFELCERTIILKEGKIMADGVTSEILVDEELMETCNLEIPLSVQNCPRCKAHSKNNR
ncbi:energy-coupling factor ABC transporter ATP-binding protein [Clostridium uliginosum]|uniref:Cobalt/nickel transport system ATP-binding protein n=1 Tax=Clostridium uliginosum TaxID=119641 RepID=A0A1I1JNK8_9CLOT|nr:ABC transporter ATP-binding protein [Clostridium uliginosum]SFC50209.1 cobalt/nickel transport system ATP-binding protein [Clostridium uliginosum]